MTGLKEYFLLLIPFLCSVINLLRCGDSGPETVIAHFHRVRLSFDPGGGDPGRRGGPCLTQSRLLTARSCGVLHCDYTPDIV